MHRYYLKHKDDICAILEIENETWHVDNAKVINREIAPFIGYATDVSIRQWWSMRAVPSTIKTMQEVIRKAGCSTNEEYLAKNLALSVTDSYWVCPVGSDLTWKDVDISVLSKYNDGKMPYHNATSYDRNATLSGQMEKYWDLNEDPPVLVKDAYLYNGQQAINELFATVLHQRQNNRIPFVTYSVKNNPDKGCKESLCDSFVSDNLEYVSAYEILHLFPQKNDESLYDAYIRLCTSKGIPVEEMQEFMDYQTLTDFLITNTDEHLNNFGVLRDSDSLKFVKPAPIYDSGNSMFYKEASSSKPLERHELLDIEITSFHSSEEKMLSHVKNRSIVDTNMLPSFKEVKDLYCNNGINEQKALFIADCYEKKVQMLHEFQQLKKISLYNEKRLHRLTNK